MGEKIRKVWEIVNGSKTIVGNTLLIVGSYMRDSPAKAMIVALGSLLTGVGLSHRWVKARKDTVGSGFGHPANKDV